jgi:hypothetical protein
MIPNFSGVLTARAFWIQVGNKHLSRQQCRELAAAELADEERARRQHERKTHAQHRLDAASVAPRRPGQHDDPRRTLLDRVMAVVHRLGAQPLRRVRLHDHSSPAPTPEPTVKPSLAQRIADALVPEPTPAEPPQSPMVVAEGSRAQVIPDSEFPNRMAGDHVLQAWRDSIRSNLVNLDSRRGSPTKSTYIG